MELRQLEYFIAVAEEASFTRAAGRLHISQSGVSAQIKQLERELGTTLFDRSARTVKLTAAGEAALGHARAALASAGALTDAVGELTSLSRGRVTVGMVVGCTITPFFDALAAFHRAYPGIEITVREGDSEQLTADMRRGTVDVALVGCAERVPENLCSFTIASEGLAALVPLDHPLARDQVPGHGTTLRQVVGYGLICLPRGAGLRAVLEQASAAQGLQPVVAVTASAADAIADLAARGLGVGILSDSMAAARSDQLQTLPIRDVGIPALLALVWHPASSTAAREFAARCRTAFGQPVIAARTRLTTR